MRTCWRTTSCSPRSTPHAQVRASRGREITVTDTVGFIQKLPTTLIEAFKSTLDEITGADLVLHVVDASSDEYEAQIAAVEDVLGQIHAQDLSRVLVFNKCDLLGEERLGALKRAIRRLSSYRRRRGRA